MKHCSPPPPQWSCPPNRAAACSFVMFPDYSQRRATVGRTLLDQWSSGCRNLYLITHNNHILTGFETTVPEKTVRRLTPWASFTRLGFRPAGSFRLSPRHRKACAYHTTLLFGPSEITGRLPGSSRSYPLYARSPAVSRVSCSAGVTYRHVHTLRVLPSCMRAIIFHCSVSRKLKQQSLSVVKMDDFEIDTELSISLVEVASVLWDKTDDIYKNRNETKKGTDRILYLSSRRLLSSRRCSKTPFWKILP